MSIHNFILQFAVLFAPLLHMETVKVSPTLYRGPDPKAKDIYVLHDKGFKTIVSLRTNPERQKLALCKKLGMNWCNIKTGVFETPTPAQFDEFRAIVNNPANQPCYVSCEVDMDRTLVYIAAQQMVDEHWTSEQVAQEFRENHQKRWWPIFCKYQRKVVEYSDTIASKPGANPATISSTKGSEPLHVQTTTAANVVKE